MTFTSLQEECSHFENKSKGERSGEDIVKDDSSGIESNTSLSALRLCVYSQHDAGENTQLLSGD